MKNFTRSKWYILIVATLFVSCSSEDSIPSDPTIPPPVVVDPNNPSSPVFPTVDPTRLVVFETTKFSVGTILSTSAVISDNSTAVITSKLASNFNVSIIVKVGVCFSATNTNPTVNDTKVDGFINAEKTAIASKISNVDFINYKKYYARTYITTSDGSTVYSEPVVLTSVKLVETTSVTNISKVGGVAGGDTTKWINATEPSSITEEGVCWSSTNTRPTIDDAEGKTFLAGSTIRATYTVGMPRLKTGTLYHYRAYIKNATGIFYGSVFSFSTVANTPYDLHIDLIENKETNSVPGLQVYFQVDSSNGEEILEVGILGSKTPSVSLTNQIYNYGFGSTPKCNFPDVYYKKDKLFERLAPNTDYYFVAYIRTTSGVYYSAEKTARTLL